ncbi:MAG: hypothetical protein HUK15_05415, partial [Bacteroidales bacterium]|nr:hypothetical protein [Bacteroidales bacterium]
MTKKKKKILKWTLIPLGSIFALLLVLIMFSPLIIQTYVNSEAGTQKINSLAGEYLNAQFDFRKINLKVWKNMPNIELDILDTEIISKALSNDLSDTLLKFDTLSISVNAIQFLKNDSIIVNHLKLTNPKINGVVDPTGKANWEIYESDTTPSEESSFDYAIKINNFDIQNLTANYTDYQSNISAEIDSLSLSLNG